MEEGYRMEQGDGNGNSQSTLFFWGEGGRGGRVCITTLLDLPSPDTWDLGEASRASRASRSRTIVFGGEGRGHRA